MASYRLVVFFVLLLVVAESAFAQTKWKTVEKFQFDWDGHTGVRVTLELPTNWDEGGEFSRVRIEVPGQKEFVLKNDVGLAHFRPTRRTRSQ